LELSVRRNSFFVLAWIVISICLFFLAQLSQSRDFVLVSALYGVSFLSYLYILFQAEEYKRKYLYAGTVIIYLICFFQFPYLSNDYYRFLWDGEMIHLGLNPYDFTPTEFIQNNKIQDCYLLDLYAGMGELSQRNFSCYPTVNQIYFYISTLFSNDIATNVLVMRSTILITLFGGAIYLEKLLLLFDLNIKRAFILLLNPLLIVESFANLHFELVMISFLIISLYFLLKNKFLLAALFFAFSVHIKLIPLILLPFVLPYLSWKKSILFYALVGLCTLLLFLVFIRLDNMENFFMSLQLYFKQFEFNSFILYPYLQYGWEKYGWNLYYLYGPRLAKYALIIILGIAWNRKKIDAKNMLRRMFLGTMVYFFLTSTVHPWYWILPLTLTLFHFSWSLIWMTFFAIFSYGIYTYGNHSDYRNVLTAINFILLITFLLEMFRPQTFRKIQLSILN
jgi:alpha-1,6-mannosyltransferase